MTVSSFDQASRLALKLSATLLITLVLALIVGPMLLIFYSSVSEAALGQTPEGFTAEYLIKAFTEPRYLRALLNTVVLAGSSTALAGLVGVSIGWLYARSDIPGKSIIRLGVLIPFFLAPFIGALAWLLLLQPGQGPVNQILMAFGLNEVSPYSVPVMAWILGLYYAPYLFIFVSSSLENMDSSMEEAGHMQGLNRWQVARRITLPLIAPAMLSGFLLTFVGTAGQFAVPTLLGKPIRFQVLPTYIYEMLNAYPSEANQAAALALVLLLVASAGVALQYHFQSRRSYSMLSGKGVRRKLVPLGSLKWVAVAYVWLVIAMSSLVPVGMLAWVSVVEFYDATLTNAVFTLSKYQQIFETRGITRRAIENTLVLSIGAAFIAVALAVFINWIMHRRQRWYHPVLEQALFIPAAVPNVVLATGLLWIFLFMPLPIYGSIWILLIGYVIAFLTHAVRNVGASYGQIDKSMEEAAMMSGLTAPRIMRHITLPLLRPGIIGAWTLLFIIYIRELSVSIFLYSPGNEVLSVIIYNRWLEGDWGIMAALSCLQILIVGFVVFVTVKVFKVNVIRS